ncbi:MAG: Pyrimidine-nucleoside phosphorylase [Myxococcota bacterium]|nr:Pyrimidine-nucleoside phosphorylase [Myxococcota bacterium]
MTPYEIIAAKRDGKELSAQAIANFFDGYLAGRIADYQMSALLMAVCIRGLNAAELNAWTSRMLASGEVLDLNFLDRPRVDKHSTGGVGDKVSIPLAPLAAACGLAVPMMSGRGLGHSGGTLDKLESIPGFSTQMTIPRMKKQLERLGVVMIGQSKTIAPADKRLYALRDVTGTVESIPLISASIMSKKLAEGLNALVLDVKYGSGAFMKTLADARRLARTMVEIGKGAGVKTAALLTAMEQPLGAWVGNALEVKESIGILRGEVENAVTELVIEQGAHMLVLGGVARKLEDGRASIRNAIHNGAGLEMFRRLVEAQGGDSRVADQPELLPAAKRQAAVLAPRAGVVQAMDATSIGWAAVDMGAGRKRQEDHIDPAAGLEVHAHIGGRVKKGQPLFTMHVNHAPGRDDAIVQRLLSAVRIGPEDAAPPELFAGIVR